MTRRRRKKPQVTKDQARMAWVKTPGPEEAGGAKKMAFSPVFKRRPDISQKVGLGGAIILSELWDLGVRPGQAAQVDWEAIQARWGEVIMVGKVMAKLIEGGWIQDMAPESEVVWTMNLAADSTKKEGD